MKSERWTRIRKNVPSIHRSILFDGKEKFHVETVRISIYAMLWLNATSAGNIATPDACAFTNNVSNNVGIQAYWRQCVTQSYTHTPYTQTEDTQFRLYCYIIVIISLFMWCHFGCSVKCKAKRTTFKWFHDGRMNEGCKTTHLTENVRVEAKYVKRNKMTNENRMNMIVPIRHCRTLFTQ